CGPVARPAVPIRQSRQWRHGRYLEYVGATEHPTTKMQCVPWAIRFVRTLRQQVLAGENVQAQKRRRLRQTCDQEMGDVLRQPRDIRSWGTVAAPVLSSAATNRHRPSVRRDLRLPL